MKMVAVVEMLLDWNYYSHYYPKFVPKLPEIITSSRMIDRTYFIAVMPEDFDETIIE